MLSNSNTILSLFKANKFHEVIELLDKSKNENKNSYMFYFYRGIAYLKLNKFSKAKEDFNKGVSLNSNSPEIFNNLGILNYTIGENEQAIENFIKSINLKNNFKQSISALINVLSHTENYEKNNSDIVSTHNKLNQINFNYSPQDFIINKKIKDYMNEINNVVDDKLKNLEFDMTQTYRRNKPPLHCDRHKKVFNTFNAIPKFCFDCFKVQIELDNVVDLIKLFIIFDNIKFLNNNTRKCMIELRPNVSGKYKGLVYCSSIKESENILSQLKEVLGKNINSNISYKIKKGCTEYAFKYPTYDSLKDNAMTYNPDWKKYEDTIDQQNPDLILDKITRPTIKGVSLYDALVIRNWLAYAKLINDKSHTEITNQNFYSKFIEKHLKRSKSA
ncbi:tetratricopeptide repeat protein [Candidatus Pelagibacter bacterium nBUS_30]|uniref:tetratricopeptide repeat protein n=1 Tax=Candidatus Pelagibacter bacterium nBUS_30 TaxID=3374191 RepID=UPI003EC125C8